MPAPHIPDGYTREVFFPEADRHPAVHIAFRPMLAAERRRLALQSVRLADRSDAGKDAAGHLVAQAISARLVTWDLTDSALRPLEIHAATVAALEPVLFEKLATAIMTFDDEGASAKN